MIEYNLEITFAIVVIIVSGMILYHDNNKNNDYKKLREELKEADYLAKTYKKLYNQSYAQCSYLLNKLMKERKRNKNG